MTAAQNLTTAETVYDFPLADIRDPSIPNYRTDLEGIDDLTASVKESGVQVPLVLRPAPDGKGHELAIGARRREAAKRAGLTTVPVFIRDLDDEGVLVARTIENLQRTNPGPLDEAEGFAVLQKRGWGVGQIAAKIGQPPRYVLERLTLCNLSKEGREALAKGEVLVGVAIEVAKLAPALQTEALKEVASHWNGGLVTVADAREAISKRVMLELGNAPFKLDDATLVPEAGPCTTCTKRTGGQAELFAEFAADLCTDSACHKSKLDALWQIRVKQAKVDGHTVLPKKATADVLRAAHTYGKGELVRLDETVYNGGKKKTLKKLFGDELPPITLARDEESGVPIELVPRAAAEKVIKAFSPQSVPTTDKPKVADAKAKAQREAERLQAEVRRRVMLELIDDMEANLPRHDVPGLQVMRVLVLAAIHSLPPDVAKTVANRRGCPLAVEEGAATSKKGKGKRQEQLTPEQRLKALVETLDATHLGGLLLELLLCRAAPGKWSEAHESYTEATVAFGVDVAAITAAVKAEAKEKAKPQRRAVGLPQPVEGVKSKRKVKHPEPLAERVYEAEQEASEDE